MFVDNDFPPTLASLGEGFAPQALGWQRAYEISELNWEGVRLFDKKLEPADIEQGNMANCWLLSALANLTSFEEVIRNMFVTKSINPEGKYVIRLYQPDAAARRPTARKNKDAKNVVHAPAAGNGQWVHITVDDYLPTKNGQLEFVRSRRGALWPCLLEKAFAKYVGSYAKLHGGFPGLALTAITGAYHHRFMFGRGPSLPTAFELDFGHLSVKDVANNNGQLRVRKTGVVYTQDTLWDYLIESDMNDYLMLMVQQGVASGMPGMGPGVKAGGTQTDSHAYTLLHVIERDGFRLCQLADSQRTLQWHGDFSDASDLWMVHPQVTAAAKSAGGVGTAGVTWMPFDSVLHLFDGFIISALLRNELKRLRRAANDFDADPQQYSLSEDLSAHLSNHNVVNMFPVARSDRSRSPARTRPQYPLSKAAAPNAAPRHTNTAVIIADGQARQPLPDSLARMRPQPTPGSLPRSSTLPGVSRLTAAGPGGFNITNDRKLETVEQRLVAEQQQQQQVVQQQHVVPWGNNNTRTSRDAVVAVWEAQTEMMSARWSRSDTRSGSSRTAPVPDMVQQMLEDSAVPEMVDPPYPPFEAPYPPFEEPYQAEAEAGTEGDEKHVDDGMSDLPLPTMSRREVPTMSQRELPNVPIAAMDQHAIMRRMMSAPARSASPSVGRSERNMPPMMAPLVEESAVKEEISLEVLEEQMKQLERSSIVVGTPMEGAPLEGLQERFLQVQSSIAEATHDMARVVNARQQAEGVLKKLCRSCTVAAPHMHLVGPASQSVAAQKLFSRRQQLVNEHSSVCKLDAECASLEALITSTDSEFDSHKARNDAVQAVKQRGKLMKEEQKELEDMEVDRLGVVACGRCGKCSHCHAVKHKLKGVTWRVAELTDQAAVATKDREETERRLREVEACELKLLQKEAQLDRAARRLQKMHQYKELNPSAPLPASDADSPFEGMEEAPKRPSLQMFYVTSPRSWLLDNTLGRLGLL